MALHIHRSCKEEIAEAADFYSMTSFKLANDFLDEIDRIFALICEAPERWQSIENSLQKYVSQNFPYSVIYDARNSEITIVAVVHHRREPNYWKTRIS